MGCLDEALAGFASDTLRGRVRRHQIGMLGLECLQPVHQHVVLRVGYFGRVENVVEMLVVAELVAEGLDLLVGRKGVRHSEDYKERARLLSREAASVGSIHSKRASLEDTRSKS